MRLVFFGTAEFALPSLRKLHAAHAIRLVVTRPSKPAGRGMRLLVPPIGELATSLGLHCVQPQDVNAPDAVGAIRAEAPEALVAVAYGRRIGPELLALTPAGVLNLHPSLLPRHRGASPVQAAILAGDEETGVTVMRMDAGLDTGPILAQRRVKFGGSETAAQLEARLAEVGAELLAETVERLEREAIPGTPQEDALATVSKPLKREDGAIDWRLPAVQIVRLWRAMHPWPGVFTFAAGRLLKIVECGNSNLQAPNVSPGQPFLNDARLFVATAAGSLEVTRIQPEGRPPMSAGEFVSGYSHLLKAAWSPSR